MKKLILLASMILLSASVKTFANCASIVEVAATAVHAQIVEAPTSKFTSGSHLKYSVMLTHIYDVVIRDKSNETFYEVTATGSAGNCKISHIARPNSEVEDEELLSNADLKLEDATVSTFQIKNQKYSIEKGVLDAAILASFPVAYNNFPRDKFYHYVAGASAALVANRICHGLIFKNSEHRKLFSNLCGFGSAVLAGALKEFYDSKGHGNVEFNDFAATALGGAVVTMRFTLF